MASVVDFAERVSAAFAKEITDQIFLSIQNNREFMTEYLHLVEEHDLQPVNQQIGKYIKKRFGLDNAAREESPKSVLIQSHQEFK